MKARKTPEQHKAEGTYREDRHGQIPIVPDELKIKESEGTEDFLNTQTEIDFDNLEDTKEVREYLFKTLEEYCISIGSFTKVDKFALNMIVDNYLIYIDAVSRIRRGNFESIGKVSVHSIANQAGSQMLRLMSEYGITPAARSKLKTGDNQYVDPVADFFTRTH